MRDRLGWMREGLDQRWRAGIDEGRIGMDEGRIGSEVEGRDG